jgi:amino acid adenylation domain-containing protein
VKLTDAQRAQYTERLRRGRSQTADGIPRRPEHASVRTVPSFGQEQLWFLDRFAPGLPTYNIPHSLRLSGELDAAALGRALDGLTARHEPLRTRFVADPQGRPFQQIDEPSTVPLPVDDLSDLEGDEREKRLARLAADEAVQPFTLADGHLLRTRLVRLASTEHVLILVVHHIVFDGASVGVLARELAALYEAETTGRPSALEPLPIQFADYALWERERCQGSALDGLVEYWHSSMSGFETLQLPTDRPRPPVDGFDGGVETLNLGTDVLGSMRGLARREGVTPFVVLLAALQALLQRYTGQDDVVVGAASANRGRPELAPLIGYLVNLVPIRVNLAQDPDFGGLLRQVREATVGAYAHQDLPFGRLVEVLGVPRDPSRAPVFQVALSYADLPEEVAFGGLAARVEQIELPVAKFDLNFFARERADGLTVELSYCTALFDRESARRMLSHLAVLTAGAVADPTLRVSQLPLPTPEELDLELVRWNDTSREPWPGCAHERFEQWAARTPDAVAAELGTDRITYAELNEQANRIARRLRGLGVGPEVLVGIGMAPSLRRLAVLLGILKAGGGYVPLDPALPAERLAFMISDAAMPVVVADDEGAAALPAGEAQVLSIEQEWPRIAEHDAADLGLPIQPSNTAYVIYTSGSTGRPKGVVVEHRNVLNLALQMVEHWSLGPSDRALLLSSLNFDASVLDWVGALLTGARAVVVPSRTRLNPSALADLLREHEVSFGLIPPAVLSLLTGQQFPHLRGLAVGGEEFPSDLVRDWIRPGLRLFNLYGPTECTVVATFAELDGTLLPPPIGLPVANTRAYVLDPHLNPVPIGVIGELHLGGASVSRGYLNAPELTQERFIPDPFADGLGDARLYRTGDLVRRLPDGNLAYCGRRDGQVKIRGLRIELGEIEAALLAHPNVAQAVVLVATDAAGQKQLVGYVRPVSAAVAVEVSQLRDDLARLLPAYMVPAHVLVLDEFPLNSSGKVDRSALPAAGSDSSAAGTDGSDGYRAPGTIIETIVADLYARLLGRDRVGADDGFFDLGGTSLQAMQLVARLRDELAVDVDVTEVFLAPAPGPLAAVLRDRHGLDDAALDAAALDGLSDEATAELLSALE